MVDVLEGLVVVVVEGCHAVEGVRVDHGHGGHVDHHAVFLADQLEGVQHIAYFVGLACQILDLQPMHIVCHSGLFDSQFSLGVDQRGEPGDQTGISTLFRGTLEVDVNDHHILAHYHGGVVLVAVHGTVMHESIVGGDARVDLLEP